MKICLEHVYVFVLMQSSGLLVWSSTEGFLGELVGPAIPLFRDGHVISEHVMYKARQTYIFL
jgi:hypothetical protein